jgi:DNA polymerase-3 subunit delta'
MGGWRVTIIDDANLMAGAGTSSASQNVLLKILEEPPKDALLILVTHGAGGLLPTIRSRCRFINFHPLSDDHVNDLLVKANGGVPLMPSDADILIALSQGSAGQAIQLFEQGGIEQIVTILDCLASLETANEDMLDRFALSFGKSGKTALDQFLFVLRWWFEMIVRMQINGQQTYTVGHIDITIPNHTQLADFLHLQENIEEHIKTCQSGNLDTRYMIFKILRMIQNG